MNHFLKVLLILATFQLKKITVDAASARNPTIARDFAKVSVRQMAKRSADPGISSYQVHIDGMGEQRQLNLASPSYSVFTPSFQYLEASADPATGQLQLQDLTPSRQELKSIEANFFTDRNSDAAVSLKKREGTDTYHISGRVDDISITHNADGLHQLSRKNNGNSVGLSDYINRHRQITPGPVSRATTSATPEVFVVFDYANSRLFGNDRNKILDYLGVFVHAINNRYDTGTDPRISFRISGVTAISSLSAQPYMENNKVTGGYDINQVLEDFAKWLYSNAAKTPKYDLAALITGTDMRMKDSNGNWESGVAGLAYMNGACWNNTYYKQYLGSSVTEDLGGFYDGMFSVAHELAHNMGAPHDGEDDATNCDWGDGYIMSYEGWGTKNKFLFSSCSWSLMKTLIDSKQGSCTKSQQNADEIPISQDNVGERLDMGQLCVKYTNNTEAVVDPDTDADSLCKDLKCRYPVPNKPGWYSIQNMNHPPGDNSPCGDGGRCVDGDCVV